MNEVATTNGLDGIPIGPRGLQMRSAGDLIMFIRTLRACGMAPDNKGENDLLIRAHYGMSLGLDPMRAVQSIYVVRNRPCVWGAAIPGLILASGKCKRWEVSMIGSTGSDDYGVQVVTERNDMSGVNTFQFTMADARRANLLGKETWKCYPADMMRWKAIGRAATSVFGDVLYGLSIVENERDIEDAQVIEDAPVSLPEATVVTATVIEPAPVICDHPADLRDRFAAVCEATGLPARDAAAALMAAHANTPWAALPAAVIEAEIVRIAGTLDPAPSPAAPVTSQHPVWARLIDAAKAKGLIYTTECATLMTAHGAVDAASVPVAAVEARIAEILAA